MDKKNSLRRKPLSAKYKEKSRKDKKGHEQEYVFSDRVAYPRIHELFVSPQGEMPQMGAPTGFCRVFGCNRRCSWCDTGYVPDNKAYKENFKGAKEFPRISPVEVINRLKEMGRFSVLELTGGEPLLFPQFMEELVDEWYLTDTVKSKDSFRVQTNGELLTNEVISKFNGDVFFVVSPKLENSGKRSPNLDQVIGLASSWPESVCLKFVISKASELQEIVTKLSKFNFTDSVVFQPADPIMEYKELWEAIQETYIPFPVIVSGQFHKFVGFD